MNIKNLQKTTKNPSKQHKKTNIYKHQQPPKLYTTQNFSVIFSYKNFIQSSICKNDLAVKTKRMYQYN